MMSLRVGWVVPSRSSVENILMVRCAVSEGHLFLGVWQARNHPDQATPLHVHKPLHCTTVQLTLQLYT